MTRPSAVSYTLCITAFSSAEDTCPSWLGFKVERRLCSADLKPKLHAEILGCQTYLWQYKCDSGRLMRREGVVEHTSTF